LLNAYSPNNNKMHPSGEVGGCKMNIRLRRRMIFDVMPLAPLNPTIIHKEAAMRRAPVTTAKAIIKWVGARDYDPPWLKYAPTIHVEDCPELNMLNIAWTACIRKIKPNSDAEKTFDVTFQLVAPRAPHQLLHPGLEFVFCEGPVVHVWQGTILDTFMAPKDAAFWYND